VTARGTLNSIRVEFEDGFEVVTSRWYVRRIRIDAGKGSDAGSVAGVERGVETAPDQIPAVA
jgi:hypothetical protein